MSSYAEFLATKQRTAPTVGRTVDPGEVHPFLHDWQAEIVRWAVERGRTGLFTTTGTGKTAMSLEWARLSGATSLILAPLAVCQQTVREAQRRLDLDVRYVRHAGQVTGPGVWISNYEMAERFDQRDLDAVVLDEGSILRDSTGKTRNLLVDHFAGVPRRMSCTATPRPNDAEELTNQAAYLSVMSRVDMLATYFIHDDQGWRLKGHARDPLFRWMALWALALRRPSDLGAYSDDGYVLPPLDIIPEVVEAHIDAPGQLFATDLGGVGGRARIRKQTLAARCERAAELVDREPGEPWLLWCALNDEAAQLARLTGAVNVHGAMSPEEKAEALLAFADGQIDRIVTKPSIAARGLNWQRCARMAFVGLSDSFEDYFQCIRRCWRYGQSRPVRAHVVLSELESAIAANVARKEREAEEFMGELVAAMRRAREEGLVAA